MPYINQNRRVELDSLACQIGRAIDDKSIKNAGELNYVCSSTINKYIEQNGLSYATITKVFEALEAQKFRSTKVAATLNLVGLEFYRRVAAPYEDLKCEENGDVYTCSGRFG